VILANINRNILLEMIPAFSDRLAPDGKVILSGILVGDEAIMREAIVAAGWKVEGVLSEGDWLAISVKA
jgi:ribosomal protein L11 methyltransferase